MPEHTQQPRPRLGDERFDGGCPRLSYCRNNPTSLSQDLQIGFARHLHLELVGSITSPNDMSVGIYKTRHENAAIRVERWFMGIGGSEFRCRTNRNDLFIAQDNSAVFD